MHITGGYIVAELLTKGSYSCRYDRDLLMQVQQHLAEHYHEYRVTVDILNGIMRITASTRKFKPRTQPKPQSRTI